MAFKFNILRKEAAADCGLVGASVLTRIVAIADTGFADAHIAEKHNFVINDWFITFHQN